MEMSERDATAASNPALDVTPDRVSGRFVTTHTSCQPVCVRTDTVPSESFMA